MYLKRLGNDGQYIYSICHDFMTHLMFVKSEHGGLSEIMNFYSVYYSSLNFAANN